MSADLSPCRSRLEQFLRRDLEGWNGLPHGCAEQEISRWLPLREGEGIVHLGVEMIGYRFRVAETVGFGEPVRLYFQDGTLSLVRTGLWSVDRADCDRLLQVLGEPDARLDLMFGIRLIEAGEWVYATRGLTLGVIPDTGLLATVSVFPPCGVAAYRRRFWDSEPVGERPAPRG